MKLGQTKKINSFWSDIFSKVMRAGDKFFFFLLKDYMPYMTSCRAMGKPRYIDVI